MKPITGSQDIPP